MNGGSVTGAPATSPSIQLPSCIGITGVAGCTSYARSGVKLKPSLHSPNERVVAVIGPPPTKLTITGFGRFA